jgi:nicotinamidase-related amidase
MSTPANFNGARPVIDVNDAVMLLIDHQSGLFQTVGDMPMPELRPCGRAGKMATWRDPGDHHRVRAAGPNGPLIPEIHANAPHAQYIARKGEINAWDNPEFVAAVKATGRKTLIIAGPSPASAWPSRRSARSPTAIKCLP